MSNSILTIIEITNIGVTAKETASISNRIRNIRLAVQRQELSPVRVSVQMYPRRSKVTNHPRHPMMTKQKIIRLRKEKGKNSPSRR